MIAIREKRGNTRGALNIGNLIVIGRCGLEGFALISIYDSTCLK